MKGLEKMRERIREELRTEEATKKKQEAMEEFMKEQERSLASRQQSWVFHRKNVEEKLQNQPESDVWRSGRPLM